MADAMDQRKLLMQNLEDAGCGAADMLHASQRQIDCLDYLIYQMDRG